MDRKLIHFGNPTTLCLSAPQLRERTSATRYPEGAVPLLTNRLNGVCFNPMLGSNWVLHYDFNSEVPSP
jgi:hypothetical protein